jgi:hypothetical protein
MGIMRKIYQKSPGMYLILLTIQKVVQKNQKYVQDHLMIYDNPNILHVVHNGELYEGKILYVIREQGHGYGFFAEMRSLLFEIMYAEQMGFVPVVRFTSDFLYYDHGCDENTINPYEYYFEPVGENMDEMNAQNVVFSHGGQASYIQNKFGVDSYSVSEKMEQQMSDVIKRYVRIKPEIEKKIREDFTKIIGDSKRVLGIHYRGTDYKVGYNVHPTQVKIEQVESVIEEQLRSKRFETVFLATDEDGIYERLKEHFGSCIRRYEDVYRGSGAVSVAFSEDAREFHHYKLGIEVLRDMYSLSLCDGLVAGLSQVSLFAKFYKKSRDEKYMFEQIIDNGINKNNIFFSAEKLGK